MFTFAQAVHHPLSSPYIGLGAYSNKQVDLFSFHSNEASLARVPTASMGIYSEKRFLLDELGFYEATIAVPTSSGNFALDLGYFGFSIYNESNLGITYARNLGSKLDIGAQFNYYNVRIAGYGNGSSVNFAAGIILHLTDNLNAGFHVYNPTGSKLGKNPEEKLSSVYSAGIGYETSESFFMTLEIIKESDKPVNVNAGLQYKILSQLMVRAGIAAGTSMFYAGFALKWKTIRLDITASYHPQLGVTPGLLLLFNLKGKES